MLSKVVSSTIFKVFGMTRPGIEPRSPGPLANTLTAGPMSRLKELEIGRQVNHIQSKALLRSARILRIIREIWGELLVKTISKLWCRKVMRSNIITVDYKNTSNKISRICTRECQKIFKVSDKDINFITLEMES